MNYSVSTMLETEKNLKWQNYKLLGGDKMLNIIMAISVIIVFSTISAGVYLLMKGYKNNSKMKFFLKLNLKIFIPLMVVGVLLLIPDVVLAANSGNNASGWAYMAAALSTGLACLGCGFAVSNVGSAALGALSENEDMLGKTLIYVGLAEGIAIYGLVISIMRCV